MRVFSSIEMSFLLPIVKHGDENGKKSSGKIDQLWWTMAAERLKRAL
jgi:hypothetical protein